LLPFTWVDVFAPKPFGGNQLAVFTVPDGTPAALMRQITRELSHSETTFLQPSTAPGADLRVRIFIPVPGPELAQEIPFAGHPILGSACVAALESGHGAVTLETGVGIVPVTLSPSGPNAWEARMAQPLPMVTRAWTADEALAEALGVPAAELRADLPVEAIDNGMQTVIIPLATVDAVRSARPNLAALRRLLGRDGLCTLVFAPGGLAPGVDVHCRVFSPFDLVAEDPATGSANGPLGEYLIRHGVLPGPTVRSEQGHAVGRPSRLDIAVERTEGRTCGVYVSGSVRLLGRGQFTALS